MDSEPFVTTVLQLLNHQVSFMEVNHNSGAGAQCVYVFKAHLHNISDQCDGGIENQNLSHRIASVPMLKKCLLWMFTNLILKIIFAYILRNRMGGDVWAVCMPGSIL